MDVEHIRWHGSHDPGEPTLRRQMESEGFEVSTWRDPSGRTYEPHAHGCDESLWVLRGNIVFRIEGHDYSCGPGDRLMLPRGVVHAAEAGPEGATYLIGQRRS